MKKEMTDTYLAIIIDEIFTERGSLKDKYLSLRDSSYFKVIEKRLATIHASFHCDIVGISHFKKALEVLINE